MTAKDVSKHISEFREHLEEELTASKEIDKLNIPRFLPELWSSFPFPEDKDFAVEVPTKVSRKTIDRLWGHMNHVPEDKKFFSKVHKILDDRQKMFDSEKIDWAIGELLAYATLVNDGHPVRLSGQDTERGTFAHRHASFAQEDVRERYMPLRDSTKFEAPFNAYNSPLSEYGVMGFEYGYTLAAPNGLTIWEAQFGDFHNVAQVIVDQYISSAEEKWGLLNGLVLYLPHGYEGQGAEHSSGRVERFLTMCGNYNIQVVNCTTPANFFHVLRRQLHRPIRVPLVVFTPKSLLRHPSCVSTLADFTESNFREIISDKVNDPNQIKRVLLCSGKIYYELATAREEARRDDVSIIRIEQLYPFPDKQIDEVLVKHPSDVELVWVQEEPLNMGAAFFIQQQLGDRLTRVISRPASGVTAEGLTALHKINQAIIIEKAFE